MKIYKSSLILTAFMMLFVLAFAACSKQQVIGELEDGVFEGVYLEEDEDNPSTGEAVITIEDGKITACEYKELDAHGEAKADEYAAISKEAAMAVEGMQKYPELLVELQDPEKIDAVSGATFSLDRFKKAVWDALSKAQKK